MGVTAGTFYLLYKRSVHTQVSDEQYQLATLINSMPDFICFKDGAGKWVAVNDFGRELYHLKGIDYRVKPMQNLGNLCLSFKPLSYTVFHRMKKLGEKGKGTHGRSI